MNHRRNRTTPHTNGRFRTPQTAGSSKFSKTALAALLVLPLGGISAPAVWAPSAIAQNNTDQDDLVSPRLTEKLNFGSTTRGVLTMKPVKKKGTPGIAGWRFHGKGLGEKEKKEKYFAVAVPYQNNVYSVKDAQLVSKKWIKVADAEVDGNTVPTLTVLRDNDVSLPAGRFALVIANEQTEVLTWDEIHPEANEPGDGGAADTGASAGDNAGESFADVATKVTDEFTKAVEESAGKIDALAEQLYGVEEDTTEEAEESEEVTAEDAEAGDEDNAVQAADLLPVQDTGGPTVISGGDDVVTEAGASADDAESADSGAEEASAEEPSFTPEPPQKRMRDLKVDMMGNITAEQDGTVLTIKFPDAKPGDWIFLHFYDPEPQELGWVQVEDDNTISIDLDGVDPGIYKITATDAQGNFIGWVRATIEESQEAEETPAEDNQDVEPVAVRESLMNLKDWLLIAVAVIVVQMAGIGAFLFTRKRQ